MTASPPPPADVSDVPDVPDVADDAAIPAESAVAEPPSRPSVAVLIPTKDRPRQLAVALRSVLAQHTDAELDVVVVGDGPQPRAAEVVAEADDPRVRFLATPAAPGRGAANLALAVQTVTSDYVAYCEDDDVWLPTHLSQMLAAADAAASVLVVSRPCLVGGDGRLDSPYFDANLFAAADPDAFALQTAEIPITHALHGLDDLDRVGGWPIEYATGAPSVLWQRMLDAGTPVRLVPWATALHLTGEERSAVPDAERAAELAGFWTMDANAIAVLHHRIERAAQSVYAARLRNAEMAAAAATAQLDAVAAEARVELDLARKELLAYELDRAHWRSEAEALRASTWWRLGEQIVPVAKKAKDALRGH